MGAITVVEEDAQLDFPAGEILVMRRLMLIFWLALAGCSSVPKSGILAPNCAKTQINEQEMEKFGFHPVNGKIVVVRIFASWCPYCKSDLYRMGSLFKSGAWSAQNVNVFLLAYRNHGEDGTSFADFVKNKFARTGIPREAVQIQYVDKDYTELAKSRSVAGAPLFEDWRGVPFALVFGKDGRLAFRGHFTMSDLSEDAHYKFISGLQHENCVAD